MDAANGNVYQGEWKSDWKEGNGEFFFKDQNSKYEGWWRDDLAVSGVYSRNETEDRASLPFSLWLPSVTQLSNKWTKLAASVLPPARFDGTKRRTDPAVATRKFERADIVYGSPLHGPLPSPDTPCTSRAARNST